MMHTLKKLIDYRGSLSGVTSSDILRMTKAEYKQYEAAIHKETEEFRKNMPSIDEIMENTKPYLIEEYDGIDNIGAERCLESLNEDTVGETQCDLFICAGAGYNLQSFAENYFNSETRHEIDKGNIQYCKWDTKKYGIHLIYQK